MQLRLGDFIGLKISTEAVAICCFPTLQTAGGFHDVTKGKSQPGLACQPAFTRGFIPGWCLNLPLHEKFHKSQRDHNPYRRVNSGIEKGYPARRVGRVGSCDHVNSYCTLTVEVLTL